MTNYIEFEINPENPNKINYLFFLKDIIERGHITLIPFNEPELRMKLKDYLPTKFSDGEIELRNNRIPETDFSFICEIIEREYSNLNFKRC